MKKIYLNMSNDNSISSVGSYGIESFRMREITNKVKSSLLRNGNFVVFTNNTEGTDVIQDVKKVNPDVFILIRTNHDNKNGIRCMLSSSYNVTNGYAKEIYKNLEKIYYDKTLGDGLVYDDINIQKIYGEIPYVIVEIGCSSLEKDVNWIINNTTGIVQSISEGIIKGSMLKPC